MNPYTKLVSNFSNAVKEGRSLPLGGIPKASRPTIKPDAPKALFFAPHPDDETISGGLALRLLREGPWNVLDVAVTQGSKKERQAGRLQELKNACDYLGLGLIQTAPNGLEKVTPTTREKDPALWSSMVQVIRKILVEQKPRVIMFPHQLDWNGTHIGVYHLVMDALKAEASIDCFLVETEFWGQMTAPNLMVEYSEQDVADLIAATSFHVGEVNRNPYHLLLPAWMQDNVRRGTELVGGQGGAAPQFMFAQLFRIGRWRNGTPEWFKAQFLPASQNAASLFQ
ncbi:MAG: PIG-L deacetylase family protein [Limisphaerales bacterium]